MMTYCRQHIGFIFKMFLPLTVSFIHLSFLEVPYVALLILVLFQDQTWEIQGEELCLKTKVYRERLAFDEFSLFK